MQHCIILNANNAVRCGIFRRFSNLDKCPPEEAGDIISGMFVGSVVLDKCVKCHDPSSKCSREIPFEAVGGGIFDCFSPITYDRNRDDVISGVAEDNVGVDVCVKFGASRLNGCRDIRGADFMLNERTGRNLSQ